MICYKFSLSTDLTGETQIGVASTFLPFALFYNHIYICSPTWPQTQDLPTSESAGLQAYATLLDKLFICMWSRWVEEEVVVVAAAVAAVVFFG